MQQFANFFAVVPDPRAANARHEFMDILFIAIAAVLCGARNCSEMELFGIAKEALLRQILKLPYGIPSHDTFSAVFRNLDPTAFAQAFGRFTAAVAQALGAKPGVVAIDGKAMKGAFEKGKRNAPRMLVTAWGAQTRLTLAARPGQRGQGGHRAVEPARHQGRNRHGRCAALLARDGGSRDRTGRRFRVYAEGQPGAVACRGASTPGGDGCQAPSAETRD